jgi:hypothetical protein
VKRLTWIVATLLVLLGSISAPVRLRADGNGGGGPCPTGKTCKPLEIGAIQR